MYVKCYDKLYIYTYAGVAQACASNYENWWRIHEKAAVVLEGLPSWRMQITQDRSVISSTWMMDLLRFFENLKKQKNSAICRFMISSTLIFVSLWTWNKLHNQFRTFEVWWLSKTDLWCWHLYFWRRGLYRSSTRRVTLMSYKLHNRKKIAVFVNGMDFAKM